jgi:hypothetical protein
MVTQELSYSKSIVRTVGVNFTRAEWKKIARLMDKWEMPFPEFCRYAVVSIADTHHSKRKDANSRGCFADELVI